MEDRRVGNHFNSEKSRVLKTIHKTFKVGCSLTHKVKVRDELLHDHLLLIGTPLSILVGPCLTTIGA